MKQFIQNTLLLGIGLFLSNVSFGYLKPNDGVGIGTAPGATTNGIQNQSKAAACAPAVAKWTLEFNGVSALLEMGGVLFEDRARGVAAYEVPKGGGVRAIFAGALWMGGEDVNGQLKLAAVRFRQVGNDFWPGPLSVQIPNHADVNYDPSSPVGDNTIRPYGDANITDIECAKYDRFFRINKAIVTNFIVWWEACNALSPTADPVLCEAAEETKPSPTELALITDWPAHGNPDEFQDYYLAPFYDREINGVRNGLYDPMTDGDYPWYDDILGRDDVLCGVDRRVTLFGDETIWFVFNDKGNVHTESQGDPIGMEVRAQAFAFATTDEINTMTFYNYELINRSTQTLTNTFFSQYLDPDIGFSENDYVGCDVSRGLGYAYNGTAFDPTQGSQIGYGNNPPAIGVDFFEGPYQDIDGLDNPGPRFDPNTNTWITPSVQNAIDSSGIVYIGIGTGYGDGIVDNERYGMRRFTYFDRESNYPYTDPSNYVQYYNFMRGRWADGSTMYYGGRGFTGSPGVTSIESEYMFPGESDPLFWSTNGVDPGFAWTEEQAGNQAHDRRFVQSAGPFTLKPGAMNNITVGIVYGRSTDGGLRASVDRMKVADTKAQALFDACFKILDPPNAPKLEIQELENELILMISNPPSSNNYNEQYAEIDDINIPVDAPDRYYRFEGYQIFQMVDGDATAGDITELSKARLVAQCDIKNGVTKLVNYTLNEQYGFLQAREMVAGTDQGIKHTFRITDDQFALSSDKKLVNHKKYYYIAVAYGYNNFKRYDQTDPLSLDGQKTPYISSRLSYDGTAVKSVEAIPHNPMPELGGTYQSVPYGTTPRITRLDGTGNGMNPLKLTSQSVADILANGKMDAVTYDLGGAPINVKVIDPLNVKEGYFTLQFRDYNTAAGNAADTARWTLKHYKSKTDLTEIGSYDSEVAIRQNNEQIIPELGISVQIQQVKFKQAANNSSTNLNSYTTDVISATVSFQDSSKRWLGFIEDQDAMNPLNWIASGPNSITDCDATQGLFNPCLYSDEVQVDDNREFAKLLGGGIAPHKVTRFSNDGLFPLRYVTGSGYNIARSTASLSYLSSVDIVLTEDKSLWTRVPVIEMGKDRVLNINNARPGDLRKSPSVDQNGNPMNDGTEGLGWFPGYAIDLETGARLQMAIGENSFFGTDGGADMIWNPSSRIQDNAGNYVMAGVQPVWVFGTMLNTIHAAQQTQDLGWYRPEYSNGTNPEVYELLKSLETTPGNSINARKLYGNLQWILYPRVMPGRTLRETPVTISIRVNKEYKNYTATGINGGKPMYEWEISDIKTQTRNSQALAEALDIINIVPNPYLAVSEYESGRLDNKVKIVNLPDECTIRIFNSTGKLVRTFKKDSPVTHIDWDLNNHQRVPVASGVYLVHVEVPGIGERVLKAYIGVRQVDLQGI